MADHNAVVTPSVIAAAEMRYFAWALSAAVAVVALFVTILLPPVFVDAPEIHFAEFLPWVTAAELAPEPLEHLRYLLIISLPTVMIFVGFFAARLSPFQPIVLSPVVQGIGRMVESSAGFLLTGIVALCALWQATKIYPYYGKTHLSHLLSFTTGSVVMVILAALAMFICRPPAQRQRIVLALQKFCTKRSFLWTFLAALLTCWGLLPGYYPGAAPKNIAFHMMFTIDEFAAPLNSLTPAVNYFPQYSNLLPLLMKPIFSMVGFNQTTFSAAMSCFNLLGLLSLFYVLKSVVGGGGRAFLFYLPILAGTIYPLQSYEDGSRYYIASYYAMLAIRCTMPFLVCAGFAAYLRKRGSVKACLLFGFATLSAANNFDFGIPAFCALLVTWIILKVHEAPSSRAQIRQSVLPPLVGMLIGGCLYIGAIVLSSHGSMPNLFKSVEFQKIFVKEGFYLLPLPGWIGLHTVVYLTYMGAIVRALYKLILFRRAEATSAIEPSRSEVSRAVLLLFLGIFGCGIGMYYIGRTHPHTLAAMFPTWLLTLGVLFFDLKERFKITSPGTMTKAKPAGLAVLFWTIIGILLLFGTGLNDLPSVRQQIARIKNSESKKDPESYQIIRTMVEPGGNTALLISEPHRVAIDLGVVNVFPYNHPELILNAQAEYVLDVIEGAGLKQAFSAPDLLFANNFRLRGWKESVLADGLWVWRRE